MDGEEQVEAIIAQSHATLWTEQTDKTMACAQRALDLARAGGFAELGDRRARHGRGRSWDAGEEGDLEKAVMLGDEALDNWPPHSRQRTTRRCTTWRRTTTTGMGTSNVP